MSHKTYLSPQGHHGGEGAQHDAEDGAALEGAHAAGGVPLGVLGLAGELLARRQRGGGQGGERGGGGRGRRHDGIIVHGAVAVVVVDTGCLAGGVEGAGADQRGAGGAQIERARGHVRVTGVLQRVRAAQVKAGILGIRRVDGVRGGTVDIIHVLAWMARHRQI